jgi:hypothetical protein
VEITDESVKLVAEKCQQTLQFLVLSDCKLITEGTSNFTEISVKIGQSLIPFSSESVAYLAQRCHVLQHLYIDASKRGSVLFVGYPKIGNVNALVLP